MKKILFCLGLVLVILFTLTGCGGSHGDGSITITFYSDATLDGYITNRLALSDFSGTRVGETLDVGDIILGGNHGPTRGYISFNITLIPTDAKIQSAVLRMYKASESSDAASIYTNLGDLLIDHIVYNSFTFDTTMFILEALETLSEPFASTLTPVNQWKEKIVTSQVQNDITNARQHAQFRLRFENSEGTDLNDRFEHWSSGDSATNKPQLVIRYTL